jgi:hypothetical protein
MDLCEGYSFVTLKGACQRPLLVIIFLVLLFLLLFLVLLFVVITK